MKYHKSKIDFLYRLSKPVAPLSFVDHVQNITRIYVAATVMVKSDAVKQTRLKFPSTKACGEKQPSFPRRAGRKWSLPIGQQSDVLNSNGQFFSRRQYSTQYFVDFERQRSRNYIL
ncbi:hypothetical protein NPIL_156121 [Nephila pilipes]|uniref:Uncharacterized protein n=1 Tax=Nephila pilipes TaxID=299642 RepID=A0A8X6NPT9_NEPPI|nr:hypothetical protein NPIL_156121 [Nephila pilipes]